MLHPLKRMKKEMQSHRKRNIRHHSFAPNYLSEMGIARIARLAMARKQYFGRLMKSSLFFRQLLKNVDVIELKKVEDGFFVLPKKGFSERRLGAKVVLLIDAHGRARPYRKEESGKYKGYWLPFNGFSRMETVGKKKWEWIPANITTEDLPWLRELKTELASKEHEIEFVDEWGMNKVNQAKKYM